jgi:hypothetical protein
MKKKKGKKQNTRNISLNIHRRFQLIDRGPAFSFALRREREGENGKYNDHRAQEKQEKIQLDLITDETMLQQQLLLKQKKKLLLLPPVKRDMNKTRHSSPTALLTSRSQVSFISLFSTLFFLFFKYF